MNNDTLFEIRTVQTNAIKTLFESLKDIVLDANLQFSPDGIRLNTFDKNTQVFVHIFLYQDKFEKYSCSQTYVTGINILNLYKILKTIDINDSITFYQKKNQLNTLFIESQDKDNIKCYTRYELVLMDIQQPPEQNQIFHEYQESFFLNSQMFQKICRKTLSLGVNIIEIQVNDNHMSFIADSQHARMQRKVEIKRKSEQQDLIVGNFNLKSLNTFTKCTSLSSEVQVFLRNDYPLTVKYQVTTLGEVNLILHQQNI